MITVLCWGGLTYFFGSAWTGWLLVLPVLLDLEIIARLDK